MDRLSRRALLAASAALAWTAAGGRARAGARDEVGQRLAPWRPGSLDIHHIATGRGDSTLVIGPDGSSLMIDAGASGGAAPPALPPRPSDARRPGEWIARYALRRLRETGGAGIDVFLATHQHPDHVGDVGDATPLAPGGGYRLTGVSDVDHLVPIGRLVDRGYPDYAAPSRLEAAFQQNYEAFVQARIAAGRPVERFRPGALNQLRRRGAGTHPQFQIRNLAVNGEVWTGEGEDVRPLFPPLADLSPADIPEENLWSAALRLSYGDFDYFAAGDLTSTTFEGALPWRDVEGAAAEAAGPVEVAVSPHHGMFDATGARAVRALQPKAWIISSWHALHPGPSTLNRLFNGRLQPVEPRVFATGLDPATEAASPWLTHRLASRQGHVVVRVAEDGASFTIVVTDNGDESDRVLAVFGPYAAN
ncbi:ComEC/Rec2 family competence protein [Phenylobacterium sp.]|uniref:ComEC/Rec2 family competence protein n=1 Tax=Phenylobacterium sp. TaxID=1871053 RepID=UPI0027311D3E|nr:MBL fold metallo-hydrolase [Phenylobacterium sp.]MDP1619223.1 MBL fold metallo-hydrolase [Phenylobacterium sp.]MDP1986441.1 MBL fold metallo-hydrolase [Phenylobacterium sp.]